MPKIYADDAVRSARIAFTQRREVMRAMRQGGAALASDRPRERASARYSVHRRTVGANGILVPATFGAIRDGTVDSVPGFVAITGYELGARVAGANVKHGEDTPAWIAAESRRTSVRKGYESVRPSSSSAAIKRAAEDEAIREVLIARGGHGAFAEYVNGDAKARRRLRARFGIKVPKAKAVPTARVESTRKESERAMIADAMREQGTLTIFRHAWSVGNLECAEKLLAEAKAAL